MMPGLAVVVLAALASASGVWTEEGRPADAGFAGEDGIPVRFTLDAPGYVTLVIEDDAGRRVRNLIAGVHYPAGTHTIYWDGYDVGRAVRYVGSRYDVERRRVAPGTYRVRGLVHDGIRMRYEMAVQSPGAPPWNTLDGSGGWLADHSPPNDVLFLPRGSAYGAQPQVMVCANKVETGHSFMWLDLAGRKLYGMRRGWRGGYALARDLGPDADANTFAYSISRKLELYAYTAEGAHKHRVQQKLSGPYPPTAGMALAVYNQVAVVSLPLDDRLAFIDLRGGEARTVGTAAMPHPKGLTVDEAGRLYVVQDRLVKRYDVDWRHARLTGEAVLVDTHLEDPRRITRDADGTLYVSDWGRSHQVKVFDAEGRWLRTIGAPGGPQVGRYDEQRMHHPNGLAVDSQGQLWVAELDRTPKRISLWTTDGAFLQAFYGPPKYGGGGVLDPADSTRFFYAVNRKSNRVKPALAFALDWATGRAAPRSIYQQGAQDGAEATLPYQSPVQPIHYAGRTYLVNTFNQAFQGMRNVVGIWLWDDATETVRLVAVVGFHDGNENHRWTELDRPDLAAHRPAGTPRQKLFYVWSDLDGDGHVQPREVQYAASERGSGRVYVGEALQVLTSQMQRLDAPQIGPDGTPRYDVSAFQAFASVGDEGAGDVLYAGRDWVINAGGPIRGFYRGDLRWIYHSQHFDRAQTHAPAQYAGQLVETSRVLGLPVHPRRGDAGPVWALNNDVGSIYLFTADGLLLQELGGDLRETPLLRIPDARRGRILEGISFDWENFWPSLTQLESGSIVLSSGKEFTGLFRLEGFETVRRRDFGAVTIGAERLAGLEAAAVEPALRRQPRRMTVALGGPPPRLDGDLGDWDDAAWVSVDARRGVASAVRVAGGRLYAAYRTGDPALLTNPGAEGLPYLIATGGGLDLMIRHPKKDRATRLFVTRLGDPQNGPLRAVLFQQGRRANRGEPMTYRTPVGEVRFDGIADVSDTVALAQSDGNYEFSIPLSVLGLKPQTGMTLKGDVGVVTGRDAESLVRLYWSNKTVNVVALVPFEARLQPQRWGAWTFRKF